MQAYPKVFSNVSGQQCMSNVRRYVGSGLMSADINTALCELNFGNTSTSHQVQERDSAFIVSHFRKSQIIAGSILIQALECLGQKLTAVTSDHKQCPIGTLGVWAPSCDARFT